MCTQLPNFVANFQIHFNLTSVISRTTGPKWLTHLGKIWI